MVEKLCPNLQFWTLQTGGKAYGVEYVNKGIDYNPPLKETMPRIPEPYASNVFYYAQYDTMKKLSKGKRWKFCEIRPDAIVGFVPQNNAMNIAQALGLFLAMYKSIEGSGSEVPFPGNEAAYKELHMDTSQDIWRGFISSPPFTRMLLQTGLSISLMEILLPGNKSGLVSALGLV